GLATVSAAIMPLMSELGLSFTARPTFEDGRYVLACTLLHASGDMFSAVYPLPTSGTPQAIGSAITYGRRYCLCAMTGVAPEADDDGAAAQAEADAAGRTAQRAPRAPRPARARAPEPPLPNQITAPQRAKLMASFGQLGVADREERLRLSAAI